MKQWQKLTLKRRGFAMLSDLVILNICLFIAVITAYLIALYMTKQTKNIHNKIMLRTRYHLHVLRQLEIQEDLKEAFKLKYGRFKK